MIQVINAMIRLAQLSNSADVALQFTEQLAAESDTVDRPSVFDNIREWAFVHIDAVATHGLERGLPIVSAAHGVLDALDQCVRNYPTPDDVLAEVASTIEVAAEDFRTDWTAAFAAASVAGPAAVHDTCDRFIAELDELVFDAASAGDEVWVDLLCEVGAEMVELVDDLAEIC
jgi:hypothetical protein